MWSSSGFLEFLGGANESGKRGVTILGIFGGESAGWRCDRKLPLLGCVVPDRSTPYVGGNSVRTRWWSVIKWIGRTISDLSGQPSVLEVEALGRH
jgi:hypothetical protein